MLCGIILGIILFFFVNFWRERTEMFPEVVIDIPGTISSILVYAGWLAKISLLEKPKSISFMRSCLSIRSEWPEPLKNLKHIHNILFSFLRSNL